MYHKQRSKGSVVIAIAAVAALSCSTGDKSSTPASDTAKGAGRAVMSAAVSATAHGTHLFVLPGKNCQDTIALTPAHGAHNESKSALAATQDYPIVDVLNTSNCQPTDAVFAGLPPYGYASFVVLGGGPATGKYYVVELHLMSAGVTTDITPQPAGLIGQFCGHGKGHTDDDVWLRPWIKGQECDDDGDGRPKPPGADQDGSEAPPEAVLQDGSSLVWVTVYDDCFPMSQPPNGSVSAKVDSIRLAHDSAIARQRGATKAKAPAMRKKP